MEELSNNGSCAKYAEQISDNEITNRLEFKINVMREAAAHMENNVKDKPYKCLYCDVAFTCRSNQTRHMALHSNYKAHICPICDKGFTRKDDLNRHIKAHVKKNQMAIGNNPASFYKSSNLSTCLSECKSVLPDIAQPMTSDTLMDYDSIQTSRSDIIAENNQISEGLCNTIVKNGRYKCPFCDLVFPFLSLLKKHIVSHSKEKPHVCAICKRCFKRKDDLAQHAKRHVKIEFQMDIAENSECSVSPSENNQSIKKNEKTQISAHATYFNRDTMNTETNNPMCHNAVRMEYECPFCSSVFSFFRALQEHIVIHSDDMMKPQTNVTEETDERENSIIEKIDDKKMSSQNEDIVSETNKNSANINTNRSENIFGQSSSTEEQLIKYHSQFDKGKGVFDGSEFFSEGSINNFDKRFHLDAVAEDLVPNDCSPFNDDIDIKDELYICSICTVAFYTKSGLVRHILLHSKERLHKCSVCKEGFNKLEELVKHEGIHLKDTQRETSELGKKICKNRKKADKISKPDSFQNSDFVSHDSKTIKDEVQINYSSFSTEKIERPYKCSVCDKAFHSKGGLGRHLSVHSKEKPHECSVCKKRFKRKDDMMRHKSVHCRKENESVDRIPKSCSFGDSELISQSDGCHSRTAARRDNNTDFSISNNHVITKLKTMPEKTNQGHRDGDVPMFSSEMKNATGTGIDSVTETLKKNARKLELDLSLKAAEHEKLEVNLSLVKMENTSEERLGLNEKENGTYENATLHICSICKKSYIRESDFTKHRKNIHNIFDKREGEQYKCPVCGMAFSLKGNLRRHMSRHSNKKPFACKSCDKAFKRRDDRDKHEQIHLLDKVTCYVCSRVFTEKKRLELHMKLHENKKSFQCTVCKKIWQKQSELDCHMRVHTNERPFKCTFCGKCFKSNSCLKLHSLRHKGEKTHKCSFCSHAFYSRGEMMRHANIHTRNKSYICHMCGKGFGLRASLKRHISIHIGMKPHKCSICPKRFNQSYQLQAHLRCHTGIKPHKCYACNKAFSARRTLDNHMLRHLGQKSVKD